MKDAPKKFDCRDGGWLRFQATLSDLELPIGTATLERVYFHGATTDKPDLAHMRCIGAVNITGQSYDSGWMHAADWKAENDYTVLAIYVFRYEVPGTSQIVRVERVKQFEVITAKASNVSHVVLGEPKTGKSTTATISCAGSFFNAQGVAMYDVSIDFSSVTAADQPTQIKIFAGPTDATLVQIHNVSLAYEETPKKTFTWSPEQRIVGDYNGENAMSMRVEITYLDPTHVDTVGAFTFSDLQRLGAIQIPGQ